ncbi:serine protease [Planktomarina temperata]|nr:serine protease [Planktomarina temperata]
MQLELSIGSYENEPIINYRGTIFAEIGRPVGRLDVLTDKGLFPCTAFIVSKKYILTNYHCSLGLLDNEQIGATRIEATQFVAGYVQTGIDEGTDKYTVVPIPIESSEKLDYAVLEVIGNPSQDYGELKLASMVPNDRTPFWVIGHPQGKGQHISREKCRASSPAVSKAKLLHTCDTLPGNSGSPVIDAGLQVVVALHHAGIANDSVNAAILMSKILENSTVLTAYRAPNAAPEAETKSIKTVEMTACDTLYSAAAEASACYAYQAYFKSCRSHSLAPIAEGYINEFCQVQEIVEVEEADNGSSCTTLNPNVCSADDLCSKSTKTVDGQKTWLNSYGIFEAWAKERGLTCGVGKPKNTLVKKECSASNVGACTAQTVCSEATYEPSGYSEWLPYVTAYVKEAKKRGLSCGVRQVIKTNIKQAFVSQSKLKRQQLQYALQKLGYYSHGLDGLWGKGTAAGFDKFVQRDGLQSKTATQVFSSLLSSVTVPSSFKIETKKINHSIDSLPIHWSLSIRCAGFRNLSFRNKGVVDGKIRYSVTSVTYPYMFGYAEITGRSLRFEMKQPGTQFFLKGSGSFNASNTLAYGTLELNPLRDNLRKKLTCSFEMVPDKFR